MIVIMMCISAILSDYKDATDKVNNGLKKLSLHLYYKGYLMKNNNFLLYNYIGIFFQRFYRLYHENTIYVSYCSYRQYLYC